MLDEELGHAKIDDGKKVVIGGIIAGKTVKYTKNDKMMAFLTKALFRLPKSCSSDFTFWFFGSFFCCSIPKMTK